MSYGIFIDVATCGSDTYGSLDNPVLAEFRIVDDNLNLIKRVSYKIIPEETITSSATATHGFRLEDIESSDGKIDLRSFLKTAHTTLTKCRDKGMYLLGFNHVVFDLEVLNRHFEKVLGLPRIEFAKDRIIDVLTMCSRTFPMEKMGDYTLDSCSFYRQIELDGVKSDPYGFPVKLFHTPWNDLDETSLLLSSCMKIHGISTLEEISEFLSVNPPYTRMTFGKYKGLPLEEVFNMDKQYLNWCVRNKDIMNRIPNLNECVQKLYNDSLENELS